MAFLVGLFAFFVAFLAFIALWLFVLAFARASALDLGPDRAEQARLQALVSAQARAVEGLGRHVAALEAELRRERPAVEILPPAERFGTGHRAYRQAADGMPMRSGLR